MNRAPVAAIKTRARNRAHVSDAATRAIVNAVVDRLNSFIAPLEKTADRLKYESKIMNLCATHKHYFYCPCMAILWLESSSDKRKLFYFLIF